MKKRLLTLLFAVVALMLAPPPSAAQNNPYDLDDECYELFKKAELVVGKDGFQEVNDAFLRTAIQKGDTKAQTLFYVERLKDITRRSTAAFKARGGNVVNPEEDAAVLKAHEELKSVARQLGYSQYFYYSYDLVQNYYYNTGRFVRVMELAQEMEATAHENNEEYGVWMSYRYMVSLYVSQNDYISAKKYILKALDIYNNTTDPVVLRQSATRLYCDLADTYPIGNDSVPINLAKAEMARKEHLDTLRCMYYRAKLSAYNKDLAAYEEARDYCKSDPFISRISQTATRLFDILDSIIYRRSETVPEETIRRIENSRIREMKYIANVAEQHDCKELAFNVEKMLVSHHEKALSTANQSKLTEMEAKLGNTELSAKVEEQSRQMTKVSRIILLLIGIILLGSLIFSAIYIGHLKRSNEKVRLANEAKTRFVQNMSHEVRTPLNAIVGFSQLLALPDGSFSAEEKDEFSGHIINNTKMLTMLLDDILNASAMDSGKYRISYEDGEVHFMCQAAISSAEHRLQPGVRMYYAPESEEPFVFRTDPRRIQQILINYLTNACKHTTKGEIKLSSSLTENPGYVTFAVTDTGPGVPPENAEKIFDRFTKLNEFVQGTGLGLSICRDIAVRMGAKVFLDTSYTAGGARFVFMVPVNPPEEETAIQ